jgi:hypothetical protein
MPEWNLRDITAPSSDFLLDMLKHRATTSLQDQYKSGVNGALGDHAHIVDMMNKKNLELKDAHKVKDGYTLFLDEESYGKSVKVTARGNKKRFLTAMTPAIQRQSMGPPPPPLTLRCEYSSAYRRRRHDQHTHLYTRSRHKQARTSRKSPPILNKLLRSKSLPSQFFRLSFRGLLQPVTQSPGTRS